MERGSLATGAGGRAERELQLNGFRVSVCKDEKILQTDGGEDCVSTCMFLAPLNCVLRNMKFHAYFTMVKKTDISAKWKMKSLYGEEKLFISLKLKKKISLVLI